MGQSLIGRVLASCAEIGRIIVDLPEDPFPVDLNSSEIMLAPWVIVVREITEASNRCDGGQNKLGAALLNATGDQNTALVLKIFLMSR